MGGTLLFVPVSCDILSLGPEVLAHVACAFSPTDVEDDKVELNACSLMMLSAKCSLQHMLCISQCSPNECERSSEKAVWISPKEISSR